VCAVISGPPDHFDFQHPDGPHGIVLPKMRCAEVVELVGHRSLLRNGPKLRYRRIEVSLNQVDTSEEITGKRMPRAFVQHALEGLLGLFESAQGEIGNPQIVTRRYQ